MVKISMNQVRDLDAVADACIAAHTVIEEHGTPEMQALIRVMLHLVGREIARGVLPLEGDKPASAGDGRPYGSVNDWI